MSKVDKQGTSRRMPQDGYRESSFDPAAPSEVFERNRVALITLGATFLAFVVAMAVPYFGYNLEWAPHRLFKVLAGGVAALIVVLRPTWIPYMICVALPFADWLPKSPVPFLNATNLLTFGSLIGIAVLSLRGGVRLGMPALLNRPLMMFMIWMVISATFAPYLYPDAMDLGARRLRVLWGVLSGFLVFFVVTHLVRDRRSVWRLLAFLMLGTTLGLLGPIRETLERGLGVRTGGGIGDINRMGAFLAFGSILAFTMIPAYKGTARLGVALSSILTAVGLILPNSRGAYIGFLISSIRQGVRTSLSGTILLVALLGSSILWAPGFVRDRLLSTYEAASSRDRAMALDEDSGGRLTVWVAILDVIVHYPIFGVGYGNLQSATHVSLGRYKAGHNLYLETAGEMGLVALLLLLWLFYRAWRLGEMLKSRGGRSAVLGRAYQGVILCMLIVNVFGQRLFDYSMAGFFFLLSGIATLEERFTRPTGTEEIE